MKKQVLNYGILLLSVVFIYSCKPGGNNNNGSNDTPSPAAYDVIVEATNNTNAPALQSFVHGKHGDDWLLFAGRTNKRNDDGGLHKLHGNYTNTSFPRRTYNEYVYVYNVVEDKTDSISITDLKTKLDSIYPKKTKMIEDFTRVFRNSNPVVKQHGEFLYVIGGYGPKTFNPKGASQRQDYITYNHLGRVNVKDMINLIRGNNDAVDKKYLMAYGQEKKGYLISTGGEMFTTGTDENQNLLFYMTGGHSFGNESFAFQKYVNAAYPFGIQLDTTNGKGDFQKMEISLKIVISDVSDPSGLAADNISAMRRRDGPIVPQVYKSPVTGVIEEGFAFFGGVFKGGDDDNLQAWNDAVYIHPSWANAENTLYTYDRTYDQKNYNVYAAPNFVLFDESKETTNTYILGGIGDGKQSSNGFLSGFTNTGMRIETNIVSDFTKGQVITSTNEVYTQNVFGDSGDNIAPFYGAEAIFFLKNDALRYQVPNGAITDIIDVTKLENDETVIGYVFGGIESFEANPEGYGSGKSRASNKVFKVTLKKK